MEQRVQSTIWAVYRYLPKQTVSSNVFGAYANEKLARKKADEFNKRFSKDKFEYRAGELPVMGE